MLSAARRFVLAAALFTTGCGATRWYTLPLTASEGLVLAPALVVASQELGLESFARNGAVTELDDGTMLFWSPRWDEGKDRGLFLAVTLPPDVQDDDRAERFADAKLRADGIWARAAALRGHALGLQPPPPPLSP